MDAAESIVNGDEFSQEGSDVQVCISVGYFTVLVTYI